MKKESIDWRILITAIIVLGIIEVVAMNFGINGGVRTLIVGIIALIAGVSVPSKLIKK